MLDSPLDGIRSPFGVRRGRAFSPSTLFALAEPGVWFDPSDLTTLFTDPAGTTPVTAPGNTVGLMLDKSKGLALGAELVANGDGTDTTGWDLGTGISALISEDGEFKATANGGANSTFSRLVTLVVGKSYSVSVVVRSPSSNSVTNLGRLLVQGGLLSNFASQVSAEDQSVTLSGVVLATGTSTRIYVGVQTAAVWGGNGDVLYADNISVRELPGNHATQATIAARPTYSIEPVGGRRNLLLQTEAFNEAAWTKQNGTITSTSETDPLGGATADKFTPTATASVDHRIIVSSTFTTSGGYTLSLWVKPSGYSKVGFRNGVVGTYATFDLSGTGSVIVASGLTASIASAANGFYRIEIKDTSSSVRVDFWPLDNSYTNGSPSVYSYTGNGTSGILFWGAQLELGSTASPYQRVTTQHDVTEAGVASMSYLYFDGVNDAMATSTITPGIDKAQVFTGVKKTTGNNNAVVVESSVSWSVNAGSFAVIANDGSVENYGAKANFTTLTSYRATSVGSTTDVVSLAWDFSATSALLATQLAMKLNGVSEVVSGTGGTAANFLAYPLYLGGRGGTSLFLSGHLYSLITRFGPTLDAPTIASTEIWVGDKTGIDVAKNISTTIYTRSGDTILDRANSTIERRA